MIISRPLLLTLALAVFSSTRSRGQERPPPVVDPPANPAPAEQSPDLSSFSLVRPGLHPPLSPGQSPLSGQPQPRPRLPFEAMVEEGKSDQVAALLVVAIRNLLHTDLDQSAGDPEERRQALDYGLYRASEEAKRYHIADQVVKALTPGPDAPLADRRLCGLFVFHLGDRPAEALEALRPVHAKMPADPLVAPAFFSLLPEAELKDWLDRFRKGTLKPGEASGLFLFLWKRGPFSSGPLPDPVLRTSGAVQGVVAILEKVTAGEPDPDLDWVSVEAQWILEAGSWGGAFVSKLGKIENPWEDDSLETLPAAVASRAMAARQLYTAMLRYPQFSSLGYTLFRSAESGLGLSSGDLRAALRSALETRLRHAASFDFTSEQVEAEPHFYPREPHVDSFGRKIDPFLPPSGIQTASDLRLAAEAGKQKNLFTPEDLENLAAAPGPDGKLLRLLLEVVRTPGVEPLKRWWQAAAGDLPSRDRDVDTLMIFMELFDRKDLFPALADLEVAALLAKDELSTTELSLQQNRVQILAAIINRRGESDEGDEVLLRVARGIIGPEAQWPDQNVDPNLEHSPWFAKQTELFMKIVTALDHVDGGAQVLDRFFGEEPGRRISGHFPRFH